ncbi:DUF3597 domain-containing protein [Caballeronia grimmiae]|uniref:DUF3597 domain-containing protein n=1 Tax=Caballeronia grimmiae TaxID=1071679 RepID=A0A069PE23_9BURK|nr:DUF3597 domain-containing protein [Caballeronia grimmiae]KDR35566.1 hypothetical protein BG57_27350 [Caballeronia grimmiae]GGD82276.1 hypothetical protein GCM10010985_40890 [Caballeronia grimmiae]
MSIFSTILNKIFPHDHPAATTSGAATPPAASNAAGGAAAATQANPSAAPATSGTEPARPPVTPMPEVDVEAILVQKQQQNGANLNWRTSIVDLMKLLDLDSSLQARKELAIELHYTGNTDDSASMNIWLHKEVMKKLAENGGKVPDDLKN